MPPIRKRTLWERLKSWWKTGDFKKYEVSYRIANNVNVYFKVADEEGYKFLGTAKEIEEKLTI